MTDPALGGGEGGRRDVRWQHFIKSPKTPGPDAQYLGGDICNTVTHFEPSQFMALN